MEIKRYGTLNKLTVAIGIYATIAEGDTAAGKEGAMLAQANDNLAYRGPLAEGRSLLCQLLEEETGIERKTKETGRKDKDGQPVLAFAEAEGAYADRVCAEMGWTDLSHLQGKFDELVAASNNGQGLVVDVKERERKPAGPKKLAMKYKDTAAILIASGNVDAFITKVRGSSQPNVTYTATNDTSETHSFKGEVRGKSLDVTVSAKDAIALGWIIKAHNEWKEAQELAEMAS